MAAKKLYRSTTDRKIAGVCGGLAEYLEVDPVVVRLIFLFALLIGCTAGLLYIIMWIIVPEKPTQESQPIR